MTIRAIIVDDESLARARLKRLLKSARVEVLSEGCNGQEAIDLAKKIDADILFIDINMPIKNGLQAADEISQLTKQPAIIFCTAYDEHAIAAFKTNAISYLLKPVQLRDIEVAIEKASNLSRFQLNQVERRNLSSGSLTIHFQGALQKIPLSDFVCFRSVEKNVFALLVGGQEVLVDRTLKQLEAHLRDDFVRVHRAALVNKQQASSLIKADDGKVSIELMSLNLRLPVSRRHLSEVKKCFD